MNAYRPPQRTRIQGAALLLVPAQATGPEGAAAGPGLVAGMAAVVAAAAVGAVAVTLGMSWWSCSSS